MPQLVEVRFKGVRKGYFTWADDGAPLRRGEAVVVEVERGHDLGTVTATGETAHRKCTGCTACPTGAEPPAGGAGAPESPEAAPEAATDAAPDAAARPVARRATPADLRTHEANRRSEDEARRKVVERARAHELVMKVSDTEWQWDRAKLTIYFTAEKRVDFRTLVRDLASLFRTRIELRQIGVRDEAALLGGVGRCGREYCCSTWLTELSPVNLALAKDQHLSLNPAQISGGCGRLLCCLKYEHEFYVAARKRFPKEGRTIRTGVGAEKVVAVDIFRERVFLRSEERGPRIISLVQLREELEEPAATAGEALPDAPEPPPAPPPVSAAPAPGAAEAAGAPAHPRRRRRRRRGGPGAQPGPGG
jgi:cell fate regulator YaaT (PSP1 superfamily)